MAEEDTDTDLAAATAPPAQRPARVSGEVLAFVLSLVWFGLLVAAFVALGRRGMQIADSLGLVVIALAVFLPVALIWLAVLILRAARQMRDESARLHQSVEAIRRGWLREQQAAGLGLKPTVEAKLEALAEAQRKTESTLAMFTTRRNPASRSTETGGSAPPRGAHRPGTGDAQPVLALENPLPAVEPLDTEDFIRALNFPDSAEDKAGFAALRRALADHGTAELVRAAQRVLTALSQEGIYMDDLQPDRARPDLWRAFAEGARGASVAGLGGIRDRSCLALTTGRMRSDPAFRDAAHRFLRAFDRRFAEFEHDATDGEIARFAETRSARAFMLLGRVTGVFG
ncbi:MAG: hypothetical protein HLUCCA12_12555 [Rhodobacteraceae bacterium HLUCCA12]|nr:MAG: hypothetical protein HLUCCA12_12555 [Rhodobacteraceae bacterium HLUCCA12]